MALTFDRSNNIPPTGLKESIVVSSERAALNAQKVNFTYTSGDGTALQSGETVNLMELGNKAVVMRVILRITTAFDSAIDIGFTENSDSTTDRDEFFDGVTAVGTYVWLGHATGNASAAITAVSTNPVTSAVNDYCITLDAKGAMTTGVADLIVEYYQFQS